MASTMTSLRPRAGRGGAAAAALVAATALGCVPRHGGAAAPGAAGPWIATDSAAYAVHVDGPRFAVTIGFRYTNHSRQPRLFPGCYGPAGPVVERLEGDRWILAYAPIVLRCKDVPSFSVPPGGSYESRFHVVAGPLGSGAAGEWRSPTVPGTYRLVFRIHSRLRTGADGPEVPLMERASNPFRLTS